MHVRVSIDVSKPLCCGRLVCVGGSSKLWVTFKYERMPIFCYWCGLIDHDEKDCMEGARSKETLGQREKQYGPWLRTSPDHCQKPQLVVTMENKSKGSSMAENRRERSVAIKPGDQLVTCIAKPAIAGANSYVVKHRETTKATDKIEVVKHVGLSDMAVTEKLGPIPWSMQQADFEERLQEIDHELAVGGSTTKLMPKNLCFLNLKADLVEESNGVNLKLLGDASQ